MALAQFATIELLGVKICNIDMNETLDAIEAFIQHGQPRLIVTADATGLVIAANDPEFKTLVNAADLVTPDGAGVLWAARRKGTPLKERVSGVDLVERCVQKGHRVAFIGGKPGIAQAAADNLNAQYPGAQIVAALDGYFPPEQEEAVAQTLAEAKPQILFVGMGMPRQERFIQRNMLAIGAAVNAGVGGSFDVFAGAIKRAPRWMQRWSLEWLWRMIQDPSKIKKVSNLPRFVLLTLRSAR